MLGYDIFCQCDFHEEYFVSVDEFEHFVDCGMVDAGIQKFGSF